MPPPERASASAPSSSAVPVARGSGGGGKCSWAAPWEGLGLPPILAEPTRSGGGRINEANGALFPTSGRHADRHSCAGRASTGPGPTCRRPMRPRRWVFDLAPVLQLCWPGLGPLRDGALAAGGARGRAAAARSDFTLRLARLTFRSIASTAASSLLGGRRRRALRGSCALPRPCAARQEALALGLAHDAEVDLAAVEVDAADLHAHPRADPRSGFPCARRAVPPAPR